MSRHRIDPRAGWVKPNGKCRWCKGEVPGRRTFCSEACIHEHKLRTQPGYVRDQVHARDKGVCRACGLDTDALRAERNRLWHLSGSSAATSAVRVAAHRELQAMLEARGFSPRAIYPGDFWQADHVVEVVRGGGGCGLENYQTLCTPCHKAKTRDLAAARKSEREAAKQPLFPRITS